MSATMSTMQAAKYDRQDRACRMPFSSSSMPAMDTKHMAAASIIILGTGAIASVSLFAVVLLAVTLLLVRLVVAISLLLLTCLTRPVSLQGLVGQAEKMVRLATHAIHTTRIIQGV